MFRKSIPTLIAAMLAAIGTTQFSYAQKNYTEGGDIHGGSHTTKTSPHKDAAKSKKFDPYTQSPNKSTRSNLSPSDRKANPNTDAAKTGKFDPYSEGAKQ